MSFTERIGSDSNPIQSDPITRAGRDFQYAGKRNLLCPRNIRLQASEEVIEMGDYDDHSDGWDNDGGADDASDNS